MQLITIIILMISDITLLTVKIKLDKFVYKSLRKYS